MCAWLKWACDVCRGIKETMFQNVLQRSSNCTPMLLKKTSQKPDKVIFAYFMTMKHTRILMSQLDSPAVCRELNCVLIYVFGIPW